MDFKTGSTRITEACVTLVDIARAAGASEGTIRQARMDATSTGYRSPPSGWESVLAKLARDRAEQLVTLAAELEK